MPPKKPPVVGRKIPAKGPTKPTAKAPPGKKPPAKKLSKEKIKKGPTKEDLAAIVIQKYVRRFLAKVALRKLKAKRDEYEELITKMQQQAYVDMVNAEREEQDRQYEKEMAERRRQTAEKKRIKAFLENSFDDEVETLKKLVKEVLRQCDEDGIDTDELGMIKREELVYKLINCADPNENQAISEASAGGANDAISYLLAGGADPNTIGHFGRTPLYRAVFAGHLETVKLLLDNGADPRIKATDLNQPCQITQDANILAIFDTWDISKTEKILADREKAASERSAKSAKRREAEKKGKEDELSQIQKEFDVAQKQVNKCYCEVEKRISEHDNAVIEGFARLDITEGAIDKAQLDLESARIRLDEVRSKLQQAKLALREQAASSGSDTSLYCGVKCNVKELEDVLFRDVGDKIKNSEKGVVVLTELGRSKQAATFLRYRDTNYVHILSQQEMEADRLRMALLGSMRFGKCLVVDFDNMDMFDALRTYLDKIKLGLFDACLDKSGKIDHIFAWPIMFLSYY